MRVQRTQQRKVAGNGRDDAEKEETMKKEWPIGVPIFVWELHNRTVTGQVKDDGNQ